MVLAKTLRVHNLAKELGVKSKAIVEKCVAEGVPDITNHMSTVKLGLAETVRQWFADATEDTAEHNTAIETAEKIDVAKVKAPRKTKAKAKSAGQDDSNAATAVAELETVEPPVEAEPEAPVAPKAARVATPMPAEATVSEEAEAEVVEKAAVEAEPAVDEVTATPEAETAPSVETAPAETAANEVVAPAEPAKDAASDDAPPMEAPAAPKQAEKTPGNAPGGPVMPAGVQNVPSRPDVVKPAGERMHTVKKVALRGPKVIRVERPEPVAPPRPRRPVGGQSLSPGEVAGITRSRGPQRGRGAGGSGGGDAPDLPGRGRGGGGVGGAGRGAGGRSRSTRRTSSRNDTLLTGPSNLSKADIEAMQDRLNRSTGFVKQRHRQMKSGGQMITQSAAMIGGKVEIEEPITIKSLSSVTGLKTGQIVTFLFKQGVFANANSAIETEKAMEVCLDYDIELEVKQKESALQILEKAFAAREKVDVRPRPPVVTVLGHVDHGKTSLLDRVRNADIATHEDGGITQHIGAYRVTVEGTDGKPKTVVFIDTPGHEAFTQMRARGAKMTDLVVLVVAADDGIMPTTVEAISHAKAAGVPIVVALNKIDLPGVDTEENLQRLYGQLAEQGISPVAWGGDVEIIKTSAMTGQGVTELLEHLDLQAEVLELTADFGGPGRGTVIEAEMQSGRGAVARVLMQDGLLDLGAFFVAGRSYGRVRDMTDDRGNRIKTAGPATPLELSGIDGLPDAGDGFYIAESLQRAEQIAKDYREVEREKTLARQTVTLDTFSATIKAGQAETLNVVLKCDVQGSVETLRPNLEAIGNDEVNVKVLHAAVGAITESDIELASASDGLVIGFHVTATPAVREIAEQRGVEIRLYRVIYEITDDVKKALEGMLTPETKENMIGRATVKEIFSIKKLGTVAGCIVAEGLVKKKCKVRLERDGAIVTEGREIKSLRRVKDEVNEVQVGTECGILIDGYDDVKPDDLIVCYEVEEIRRTLDG